MISTMIAAGCTMTGAPDNRPDMLGEIMDPDEGLWQSGNDVAVRGAAVRPPPEAPSPQNKKAPGRSIEKVKQEEPKWERWPEEVEIAIIRDHLDKQSRLNKTTYEPPKVLTPKIFGVSGHLQLVFPGKRNALEGFGSDNPTWDQLAEDGVGGGVEFSLEAMPAVQFLVGVKFNSYKGATEVIRATGGTTIRQISESLRFVPFYACLRVNFPLNMETDRWFDTDSAGLATGVIPYLRMAAGGAYCLGNELVVDDVTNNVTTRMDFIKRGFAGYTEFAVGVEFRNEDGYSLRIGVGLETYYGLDLEKNFLAVFPGVQKSRRFDQFALPRISASIYF